MLRERGYALHNDLEAVRPFLTEADMSRANMCGLTSPSAQRLLTSFGALQQPKAKSLPRQQQKFLKKLKQEGLLNPTHEKNGVKRRRAVVGKIGRLMQISITPR